MRHFNKCSESILYLPQKYNTTACSASAVTGLRVLNKCVVHLHYFVLLQTALELVELDVTLQLIIWSSRGWKKSMLTSSDVFTTSGNNDRRWYKQWLETNLLYFILCKTVVVVDKWIVNERIDLPACPGFVPICF